MIDDDGPSEGEYQYWCGLLHEMEAEAGGQVDREPLNRDSIWTTRDRKRIAIRDMDDNHLLNTIRVLRFKSPIGTTFKCDPVTRREWLNAMANEAYARGLSFEEIDDKDPVHE